MAAFAAEQVGEGALVGVKDMVDAGLKAVPAAFIRQPHERPQFHSSTYVELPIIDISDLHSSSTRPLLLRHIAQACKDWGFFQVVNHGVVDGVVEEMRESCLRFFQQPSEERNKVRSENLEATIAYSTTYKASMQVVRDWREVLYVRNELGASCNGLNNVPGICREAFQGYQKGVENLGNVLYEAIFESLGLSPQYMKEALPPLSRLVVSVNYYPQCPDPSLTFGVGAHSDICALTILLQDDVPGLQIKKGDEWVLVKPLSNSFVINVGDQIELLSNGKYQSIEHRAITNFEKSRMSIACFFEPKEDEKIAPLSNLISESEPPLYKEVTYGEYFKNFMHNALVPNKGSLDFAKLGGGPL